MNDVSRALLSAAVIVLGAFAVGLGSQRRDQADLGQASGPNLAGLMASTSEEVDVPAGDYFHELSQKLRREYVEPIPDGMKLAVGAVRGMVGSLADPHSLFMDAGEYKVYRNMRQGNYEGIGVDLVLRMPKGSVAAPKKSAAEPVDVESGVLPDVAPRLMVASVVPGGPADRAGVRPGDLVEEVGGHWVYNPAINSFIKKMQSDLAAKRIDRAKAVEITRDVRKKLERAMMPLKARDRLILGTGQSIKIVWDRKGALRTTEIKSAASVAPGFQVKGDTIRLPLRPGVDRALKDAISGKSAITLDLRNNVLGDVAAAKACLEVLAPKGTYGQIVRDRTPRQSTWTVTTGNPKPPKLTLVTDATTRGAAEILALALSTYRGAKLTGSAPGGDRAIFETYALPDGSGYTLRTGEYRPLPKAVTR